MSHVDDQLGFSPEMDHRPAEGAGPHHLLLVLSAVFAGIAMIVAGGYGIHSEILSLKALSIEAALVAILCLTARNAQRIRFQLADVQSSLDKGPSRTVEEPRIGRWGDVDSNEEYDAFHDPYVDVEHARFVHYLYASVCPTALLGLLAFYQLWSRTSDRMDTITLGSATALCLLCLTASCIWLVLARLFAAISKDQLPESDNLAFSFREIQWFSIAVAGTILGCLIWAPLDFWMGRLLLVWILAICTEQMIRLLFLWLKPSADDAFLPPLHLRLREALTARRNPIASLFELIETRLGVSFRSSWAIQFVKRALVPLAAMVLVLLWGLSSLSIIKLDHLGVRESLGCVHGAPLPPGIHWKLPWPFGRIQQYPAKKVFVMPVGFVSNPQRQPAYLWSKKHAKEEFNLVLGDGAELVSLDCVVYYKIHEDRARFLNYVYHFQNPDDALEAYAYHCLMEQTRSATLDEILTTNRAQFANRLEELLRQYAAENRLGIDVVDVALMGLHPPIAVASDYLDVISAGVDADRFQTEATGKKDVQIETARRESTSAVATASADSAKRIGEAQEESSQFIALGQAYSVAPDALQQRLWFEGLEEILEEKPFALVDKTFVEGPGGILLDQRAGADVRDPVPVSQGTNQ
ncbi:MAG: protease modulator HflK [Pirellulales bacterium]|nr:protease modulator HflK [Pirellulales bacterium]